MLYSVHQANLNPLSKPENEGKRKSLLGIYVAKMQRNDMSVYVRVYVYFSEKILEKVARI